MTEGIDVLVCDLLLPIYRAAREVPVEEFQGLALGLLHKSLRFDSGRWGMGLMTERGIDTHAQTLYREPEDMAADYAEVRHQDTLARAATQANGGTVSATTAVCFAGKRFAGIREYTRRYEHNNTLISVVTDRETTVKHWLSLFRADETAVFDRRDRTVVGQLMPHLREALAINQLTGIGRAARRNDGQFGCAVADRAGLIHHADGTCLALLAEDAFLCGARRLGEPVVAALLSTGRHAGRRVVIEARPGGGLLFLKVRPATSADRLSPREREIAKLVADGLSHKEIATRLKLAPTTVRTHVHNIHLKLETHSLVDIARCLWQIET